MGKTVFYFEISKSFRLLLTASFGLRGSWCPSPAVIVCEAGDTLPGQVAIPSKGHTKTNDTTIHTQGQFRATN